MNIDFTPSYSMCMYVCRIYNEIHPHTHDCLWSDIFKSIDKVSYRNLEKEGRRRKENFRVLYCVSLTLFVTWKIFKDLYMYDKNGNKNIHESVCEKILQFKAFEWFCEILFIFFKNIWKKWKWNFQWTHFHVSCQIEFTFMSQLWITLSSSREFLIQHSFLGSFTYYVLCFVLSGRSLTQYVFFESLRQ